MINYKVALRAFRSYSFSSKSIPNAQNYNFEVQMFEETIYPRDHFPLLNDFAILDIFSDIKSYTSSEMILQVQSSLSAIVRAPLILPAIS